MVLTINELQRYVAETNRPRSLRESLKQHGRKVKQHCEVYHSVLPLVAEDVGPFTIDLG
jgi:hypothetical protein